MRQSTWRKAKIKFLTEQHHNLIDYGYSTRGCDTIPPGEVREVVFENWDGPFDGMRGTPRFAHIEFHDVVLMNDADFELLELGEPEDEHPTQKMLRTFRAHAERLVENIGNVTD